MSSSLEFYHHLRQEKDKTLRGRIAKTATEIIGDEILSKNNLHRGFELSSEFVNDDVYSFWENLDRQLLPPIKGFEIKRTRGGIAGAIVFLPIVCLVLWGIIALCNGAT